jgi:hypothetical protein
MENGTSGTSFKDGTANEIYYSRHRSIDEEV